MASSFCVLCGLGVLQKWSQHLLQVWMERAGRQADLSSLWGASGTTPTVMDVLERLLLTEKEEEGEGEGEEEEEERDEQVQAGPQGDW